MVSNIHARRNEHLFENVTVVPGPPLGYVRTIR